MMCKISVLIEKKSENYVRIFKKMVYNKIEFDFAIILIVLPVQYPQ